MHTHIFLRLISTAVYIFDLFDVFTRLKLISLIVQLCETNKIESECLVNIQYLPILTNVDPQIFTHACSQNFFCHHLVLSYSFGEDGMEVE